MCINGLPLTVALAEETRGCGSLFIRVCLAGRNTFMILDVPIILCNELLRRLTGENVAVGSRWRSGGVGFHSFAGIRVEVGE